MASNKPVNGVVQPPTVQRLDRPGRHTNQLEYILKTVMKSLWNHHYAYPFQQPVNAKKLKLPDYHDIIKQPMDLATIKKRLANSYYWSATEAAADINLIFTNCSLYNKPTEDVIIMAKVLESVFLQAIKDMPKEELELGSVAVKRGNKNQRAPTSPKTAASAAAAMAAVQSANNSRNSSNSISTKSKNLTLAATTAKTATATTTGRASESSRAQKLVAVAAAAAQVQAAASASVAAAKVLAAAVAALDGDAIVAIQPTLNSMGQNAVQPVQMQKGVKRIADANAFESHMAKVAKTAMRQDDNCQEDKSHN
ncbi:GH22415 [Drosophila grimshawi]|uniref:GH22415 n=2 Tax=Drosophila grimshawi TaxID=7222 RepID=B4JZ39_DROGR|nr:GH22415 [Drosophila grimshawi]